MPMADVPIRLLAPLEPLNIIVQLCDGTAEPVCPVKSKSPCKFIVPPPERLTVLDPVAVNANEPIIVVVPAPNDNVLLTLLLGLVIARLLNESPDEIVLVPLFIRVKLTRPAFELKEPDVNEMIEVLAFSIVNSPLVEVKLPPFIINAPLTRIC